MPARPGQIEFVEDLLEAKGLTRDELAELSGEPSWATYEAVPPLVASEIIEWLKTADLRELR